MATKPSLKVKRSGILGGGDQVAYVQPTGVLRWLVRSDRISDATTSVGYRLHERAVLEQQWCRRHQDGRLEYFWDEVPTVREEELVPDTSETAPVGRSPDA